MGGRKEGRKEGRKKEPRHVRTCSVVPRRRHRRMTQTPSTVISPCSPGLQLGGSLDEINFVSKEHEWEATPRMTMGKRIGIHARAHPSDNTNLHVNLMKCDYQKK